MKPKIARALSAAIICAFLATCDKGGGDDNSNLLLLLLLSQLTQAGGDVCTPQMEVTENTFTGLAPISNFYGAGLDASLTAGLTVNVGPSTPSAIMSAEFDHAFTNRWVDFGLGLGATAFLSRNVPLALTYGSTLLPYGAVSTHYTGPATALNNAADQAITIRPIIPPGAGTVRTTLTRSLVPATFDEINFSPDTSTTDYSQRGRAHRWATERAINVHLIFVSGADENATEAGFAPVRQKMTEVLGQSTVRLRPIFSSTVVNDASLLDVSNLTDESGTLGGSLTRLFTATVAAQRADALNIIVTKQASALAGLLGVSGGIPGTVGRTGKRSSAMVVFVDGHQVAPAAALSASDLQFLAGTIVHEGLHFLGLFHTVERQGRLAGNRFREDALIETPACDNTSDANTNGLVEISECSGMGVNNSGGRNVMFWAGSSSVAQEDLTGEQGFVVRRNPLVCAGI